MCLVGRSVLTRVCGPGSHPLLPTLNAAVPALLARSTAAINMANGVDAATQTTESVVNHHIDTSQAVESHPLEQVAASSAVPSSSTFLAGPLIQEPTSITSKESPVVTPTPRDDLVNNRQFSFVDEPATLNGQSAPLDTSIPIRDQHADVNVKPDAQSKPRPKEPFKMPRNKQEALDLVRMRKHTLRKACFFFERRTGTLGIVVVWLVIGAWMGGKSFISASGQYIDIC